MNLDVQTILLRMQAGQPVAEVERRVVREHIDAHRRLRILDGGGSAATKVAGRDYKTKGRSVLNDIVHGRRGYEKGCGCDVCRSAAVEHNQRMRQQRRQPGAGVAA